MLLLLALCWFSSPAWATSSLPPAWKQNMKVGVEVGFGVPYALILGSMTAEYLVDGTRMGVCSASPNVRLGAVWGYNFPLGRDFRLGPEVGLAYSMTQRFKIPLWGVTIEEQYLKIPIGIKVGLPIQKGVLVRQSLTLGYEFDILLSSKYKQSGGGKLLPNVSWQGDKNLKETIPDLSKLTGSIFFDSNVDFPNGFYIMTRVRFPVVEFMAGSEKEKSGQGPSRELDSFFMHLTRVFSTSLMEFNLGVDIMKWF